MSNGTIIGLGALAGGTIFLGLPFARIKNPPRTLQGFLNAVATGILFFLLYDVLANASEPVNHALRHEAHSAFVLDLVALILGLAIGLLALVVFEQRFLRRGEGSCCPAA